MKEKTRFQRRVEHTSCLYGPQLLLRFEFLHNRQNMRKSEITLREFLFLAQCNEKITQRKQLQGIFGTQTVQSFYRIQSKQ
ncbi:hypothetical protein BHE17_15140 [Planococcus maritimus]|nr:hypothetical protein AY633_07285 [Planococcus maritimus]OED33713.1 hypothetical protein BHE17_15140 [Planococcus maritimus]